MSDIIDALNLSASASIKYGTVKGSGSASFVHENKVSQSDVCYIITVKVTNETRTMPGLMIFNPLEGLDPEKFTDVFGDCFISGFLEGGEFNAIVSIKVDDKSKIKDIKTAAEAELAIAAAPGLSVGASSSTDKKKSSIWNDTETTISVNWSGGGEIKDPETKWDLATVVEVASRFPHLVQTSAQRTSAILTRYTNLRSFVAENSKLLSENGKDGGYVIKNYELCRLYSMDLFSAYMFYKTLWTKLSNIMKHAHRYQEREKSKEVPEPVALTPESLNEARLLVRKQMTLIADENARLVIEPELADVDKEGTQRPLPYTYPGQLAMRLPIQIVASPKDNSDSLSGSASFTGPGKADIGIYADRDDLHFSPLLGDGPPPSTPWRGRGRETPFCTLDSTPKSSSPLTKLRFHAHEHHLCDILADFRRHSRSSQGCLSAIEYSTFKDANTNAFSDGTHHHVGRMNNNPTYWSRLADLSAMKIANVAVEHSPGSGSIAAIVLRDAGKNEVTSWRQYGQAKIHRPAGLKVNQQSAPDRDGNWQLVGFWGYCDAILITRIGTIWKEV